MKRTAGFLIFLFLFSGAPLGAGTETSGDYFRSIGLKFVRGIGNVLQSPAEIPCTMVQDTKRYQAAGLASGFGKGIWYMVRRIWIGVDEAATFVIPMEGTLPPVCRGPSLPAEGAPGIS